MPTTGTPQAVPMESAQKLMRQAAQSSKGLTPRDRPRGPLAAQALREGAIIRRLHSGLRGARVVDLDDMIKHLRRKGLCVSARLPRVDAA